jgi:tetraacyldisaccharide 4'-kinase
MPIAPGFWGKEPGLAADLLRPCGIAWDTAGRLRRALARSIRMPVPVICVGNLVVGGAGKTPITMALADWFGSRGVAVHILARGYRGRLAGPIRVDTNRHDAGEVGDEALLLADRAATWIARDRVAGVRAAMAAGAGLILLDDGFQNPALDKTLSLIVIDAGYGFGNRRVMPAGPLREHLARGLARADAVVSLTVHGEKPVIWPEELDAKLTVIPALLRPLAGERLAGERVVAFAGIGRPSRFFATLRALGVEIVRERAFPDHFRYRESDIAALSGAAARARARLVTTAKDFVRLPAGARDGIEVLEVAVEWPDSAALAGLLAPVMLLAGIHANPEQSGR